MTRLTCLLRIFWLSAVRARGTLYVRAAMIAAFAAFCVLVLVVAALRASYPATGYFSTNSLLRKYLSNNSSSDLQHSPLTLITYTSTFPLVEFCEVMVQYNVTST